MLLRAGSDAATRVSRFRASAWLDQSSAKPLASVGIGVVVRAGAANTTATGLGTALGEDEGLKIISVGTADTVTSVDYFVYYTVTEAKR